jgi:hypothetical protein
VLIVVGMGTLLFRDRIGALQFAGIATSVPISVYLEPVLLRATNLYRRFAPGDVHKPRSSSPPPSSAPLLSP